MLSFMSCTRARNKIKKGHSQNEQNGYGSMLFHRTFLRGTVAIGKGTIAIGRRCRRLFRALMYYSSCMLQSFVMMRGNLNKHSFSIHESLCHKFCKVGHSIKNGLINDTALVCNKLVLRSHHIYMGHIQSN